ncbi:NADP-dependent phosphogluconate dehydrogenase [Faecalicoccus pleomorphus]|uniref:NADP-dependent phosphogluconate dehydrogenase n=1 Tax=Faecalicoccus pleomorphus TaxID=1323 RepID=UPI001961DF9C|nr:NADP-dependent phosphogluconate dehydrogenase [Faecalicoccus pleomorphus]MBM6764288.1 NADP-dependent phosphogluconate dehydrogenase [Faecalicoccus pleomorphus]
MNQIAVIGLGVMGKAIAQNMMNHGFRVAGYNRTYAVTETMQGKENFIGYKELKDAIESLEKPRKIFMMVPAGPVVDAMIDQLEPFVEAGDIVMDAGNSYFEDDARRGKRLEKLGVHYLAVGVSGGEMGALHGPSIMPSGSKKAYDQVAFILETIAAQKDGEPCCTYIGPEGSGHYVKMVHNGIEYADMQLIVEAYIAMKAAGMSNQSISDVLESWNQGPLESYLLSITIKILREKDPDTQKDLVDLIVDASSNKGTGKWTSQCALVQDINVSLIHGAYMARLTSNDEKLRHRFPKVQSHMEIDTEQLRQAYFLARVVAYEQGFRLYSDASKRYGWDLNLSKIASIFRAGCIIQANLLEYIRDTFGRLGPDASLFDDFEEMALAHLPALKTIVTNGLLHDISMPLFTAALTYIIPMQQVALGANLIQAQRDFFGAHTFKRVDKEGVFHHRWE